MSIPADVSVVALGIGDHSAEMVSPALTTVAPSGEVIAHTAVDALVEQIEGRFSDVIQQLVTPVMVIRGSLWNSSRLAPSRGISPGLVRSAVDARR